MQYNLFRNALSVVLLIISVSVFAENNSLIKNSADSSTVEVESSRELKQYPLGVIGEVEPVFIPPFKDAFSARIDTGAETSSIDARNISLFERDGKQWVSFDMINPRSRKKVNFKRRLISKVVIRRQTKNEDRYTVEMQIRMGTETLLRKFTLVDRSKFNYPVLVGRNILAGLAVVDVNKQNTLK